MSKSKKAILYVEDDLSHVKLVQRAFKKHDGDFELLIASSLAEAKVILAKENIALLLADYRLHDGEGLALIPDQESELQYPIVILSSQGNESVAVSALKRGVLDYVVKSEHTFREMPRIAERVLREWQHVIAKQKATLLLESVVKSLPSQVFVLDDKGIVLLTNTAFEEESESCIFRAPEEMVGMPYVDYLIACEKKSGMKINHEAFQKLLHHIGQIIDGIGSHCEGEYLKTNSLSKESWYRVQVRTFLITGERHITVIFENITEQKIVEKKRFQQAITKAKIEMLSPREREVLTMVAQGDSNKAVAGKLNLSERTVEKHRASAMKKLEVRSLANLVRLVVLSEETS